MFFAFVYSVLRLLSSASPTCACGCVTLRRRCLWRSHIRPRAGYSE